MKRSIAQIEAHIEQVASSLRDSQEHSQISDLEERLGELQDELKKAKGRKRK